MHLGKVLCSGHCFLGFRRFLFFGRHQCSFKISFGTPLIFNGLSIRGSFLRRVLHKFFVLCLIFFLFSFDLGDLLVQISDHHVQHRNHTGALFSFLRIGTESLWWWRWCNIRSLRERCCWWWLVKFRVVKFVETILRNSDDLLCRIVICQCLHILFMLFFPVFSCLCHLLVKRLDAILECLYLVTQCGDALLIISNCLAEVRDRELQCLEVVLSLIDHLLAILLLVVVILLLLFKKCDHVRDHLENFFEADLLALECERDEVNAVVLLIALVGLL